MQKMSKRSTINRSAALLFAVTAGSLTLGQQTAHAQAAAFPDVPQNHWAYQAVQDLADKGLVKGYTNGEFLGKRTLTRYEFATVIDRMLQTIADMKQAAAAPAPTAPAVTQDDLNKIQVLVDAFRTELTGVEADVKTAQDNIDAIRADILDTKDIANKALDTANASYGVGSKRKFQISGYLQARFINSSSKDQARFPNGNPAANSPYNGNYAQGGAGSTFNVRRARLKFTGVLSGNTNYAIQLDASGISNPALSVRTSTAPTSTGNISSAAEAVTIREANINYTFGDGTKMYPTLTVGMFANPFGYILPLSSSASIPGERPLAFNEGGAGVFANQDYDRGAQLTYSRSGFKGTVALVNGNGLVSNATDRIPDQIYRLAYTVPSNQTIGLGVSYYNGHLPGTGVGLGSVVNAPFANGKKQLTGFDAQFISPSGPFLLGEYLSGTYESVSAFSSGAATGVTTTNPARGNKIDGYYVQGGYTMDATGNHAFTVAASYDVLRRSKSGRPDSGSSYDDKNLGYGVLYNLDKATRVRVWYTTPQSVAHTPAAIGVPKISLLTTELQVKF